MAVLSLAAGAAGAVCMYKQHMKNKERRKWAKTVDESLADAHRVGVSPHDWYFRGASLQQVLAMLVDGVYYRDHKAIDFPFFVKPLLEGEYLVDERTAHFAQLYWTRMACISEDEEREVGLKHYVRTDHNPNRFAPRLVIAIRGTKLSSGQDLVDDIRIARHTLHFSSRFERCQNLIEKIILEFRKLHPHSNVAKFQQQPYNGNVQQQHYNVGNVQLHDNGSLATMVTDIYITGHSLGAAMALQIGKHLAAVKREWYSVHCFNPPFLTIVQLIQEGLLVEKSKDLLHKLHFKPILHGLAQVKDTAKVAVAFLFGDRDQLLQEMNHFVSLMEWVPVLYVNAHDRICKKFLRYYQRKHSGSMVPICSQAMLSRALGRNAKYSSLVPSVNMFISKLKESPHDLKNWYKDPPLQLEYREFRTLLGSPFSHLVELLGLADSMVNAPRISNQVDHSDSDSDSECNVDYGQQHSQYQAYGQYSHAFGQHTHQAYGQQSQPQAYGQHSHQAYGQQSPAFAQHSEPQAYEQHSQAYGQHSQAYGQSSNFYSDGFDP